MKIGGGPRGENIPVRTGVQRGGGVEVHPLPRHLKICVNQTNGWTSLIEDRGRSQGENIPALTGVQREGDIKVHPPEI